MGFTKRSYLELQLYKFARINSIRREFKNHYYFKGVGVVLHFQKDGFINVQSIPFNLLGYSCQLQVTSIPQLIYKLVLHRFLPVELTDLKYKPFNYTQTQLNLFTEYEEKLIELRKLRLLELIQSDLTHYYECAIANQPIRNGIKRKLLKPNKKCKQQNNNYKTELINY